MPLNMAAAISCVRNTIALPMRYEWMSGGLPRLCPRRKAFEPVDRKLRRNGAAAVVGVIYCSNRRVRMLQYLVGRHSSWAIAAFLILGTAISCGDDNGSDNDHTAGSGGG